ncbi:MAG: Rab family GTPase [Saprospiraceae bacterium]
MTNCKVLLTGCFSVGKTSLFKQFLYQKFDDEYHTTIGVKVDKKVVSVEGGEVSIMLWDLAGEVSQDKVPKPYFLGAKYILYVIDISRPFTWENLESDMLLLKKLAPGAVIKIVANKKDLLDDSELAEATAQVPAKIDAITSAQTGENIENLFKTIADEILSPQNILS